MEEKNQPITDAEIVADVPEEQTDRKPLMAFVAGLLTAVLLWYVYGLITEPKTDTNSPYPAVVATVDGEEIPRDRFTQSLNQSLSFATAQGADVTDAAILDEVEAQALESVINTRLLVAAATDAGYTTEEAAIDTQIDTLATQYGGIEAFMTEVAAVGLDEVALRKDIEEQLIVDQYLQAEVVTDVDVTEEEVAAFYESLTASGQEVPPLEEIGFAIGTQLRQQKEQELVLTHLDTLREQAEIEINI